MSCATQDLIDEASCFACVSPGFWDLMETQLLCNWAGGVTPPVGEFDRLTEDGFIRITEAGDTRITE